MGRPDLAFSRMGHAKRPFHWKHEAQDLCGSDPGRVILAVNAVIAAIGGTYASTHSLAVTVVAGCGGVACAVLLAWKR
jgi:hypothetical protein